MFWHPFKKIVANDDEMVEGMVVPVGDRELILAPYLRVGDDVSHEEKLIKKLEEKILQIWEMIVDRDSSWKSHTAGQEKFSRVPLNVASLANISDAACSNLTGDVSD